ncbi:alanine--tRNA ligase-related protein [Candidatus Riesia pediculicola]|uniref:Alanine--tRNA ligase n=1 Tax=Riesia pediculicola (strain USDA) TaxID=515618 RepID=D4G7M4_RIEPU|nr:alanine--tRNA ligase-related protein [Candidatus Riesia pediculicola]ADD79827.1 alanyl-tRNA synthetase [Candidatus Riesia pediculicola USDA]ARC53599.1 hypothetical protein AOE55_00300 [Candidatus Riesia pediculicola]QOJ86252.1 hypothetical protein ILQ01_00240 [Candidatus Riesia pediculicola]
MINRNTHEIRKIFLRFFQEKDHLILPGSKLVPSERNSSLLFTNAGMNQFRENFFKKEKLSSFTRVATSQYCIRAGGKFSDLENVGYTNSHHTLFEMLGNFSFGDYFRSESIEYAWELLTSKKWFGISKNKILITVHHLDEESYDIWANQIGISKNKIFKIEDKENHKYHSENFWKMGKTGPCGPSTEIFYNFDEKDDFDGSLESFERRKKNFIEIWNIVFIQFNLNSSNKLEPLRYKSIDTGMGLERIASVIQNVKSNYQIDTFKKLIQSIRSQFSAICFKDYTLRILSDHIRSIVLIINENIKPSNVGRGYVIRKIIRRAVRKGYLDGIREPFLYKIVSCFTRSNEKDFKYVKINQKIIEHTIKKEEKQFLKIILVGIKFLKEKLKNFNYRFISEKDIFLLHDTYGLPIDIAMKICKEHGTSIKR